jgi:hypothetical protein
MRKGFAVPLLAVAIWCSGCHQKPEADHGGASAAMSKPNTQRAKTARIILNPAHPKRGTVELPFADATKSALLKAGYSVDDASLAAYDVTIEVKYDEDATGSNFAMYPAEDYRWTQAGVKGKIIAHLSNGTVAKTVPFSGEAQVDFIMLSRAQSNYSHPTDAPYRQAYDRSKFSEIVGEVIDSLPSEHAQ